MNRHVERLLILLLGLLLTIGCCIGASVIVNMIMSGALKGNLAMVVAGGILAYLFFGFLCLGVIFGLVIIAIGVSYY